MLTYVTLLSGLAVASSVPLIKILPLGDSITFGCGSDAAPPNWYACCNAASGGYRAPLWAALNGSAINASIQMVGTESNGPFWVPQEQRAHEGHPGWTISRIKGLESKWVALAPDVVLLMAATNDIGQNHTAAQIQTDMRDLLATLRTTLPLAKIYVTSILNFYSSNDPGIPQAVETFNAALPPLVSAIDATFVDINRVTGMCAPNNNTLDSLCSVCNGPCGGYNPAVCPPEGYAWCHPSGAGYDLVGGVWAGALLNDLKDLAAAKALNQ